MKELKEILVCTTPFVIAAMLVYPFMAIVGADFDPFEWERHDRMFYFICAVTFGYALFNRVTGVSKEQV